MFFFSFCVSTLSLISSAFMCLCRRKSLTGWTTCDSQETDFKTEFNLFVDLLLWTSDMSIILWIVSSLPHAHTQTDAPIWTQAKDNEKGLSHNFSFSTSCASLQLVLSHLCLWLVNTLGIIRCNRSCFVYSDDFYLQPIELFHNIFFIYIWFVTLYCVLMCRLLIWKMPWNIFLNHWSCYKTLCVCCALSVINKRSTLAFLPREFILFSMFFETMLSNVSFNSKIILWLSHLY